MTDVEIYIQRKRASKDNWIWPAPPTGNTEQQYRVFFGDREIGSWTCPEHDAARWLVAEGLARRDDRLVIYRRYEDKPDERSMTGSVGWFADTTVRENDREFRIVPYKPFSHRSITARTANSDPSGTRMPDAS